VVVFDRYTGIPADLMVDGHYGYCADYFTIALNYDELRSVLAGTSYSSQMSLFSSHSLLTASISLLTQKWVQPIVTGGGNNPFLTHLRIVTGCTPKRADNLLIL